MLDDIFAAFEHDPEFDRPKPGATARADNFDCDDGLDQRRRITSADAALAFMTGGKAIVTLVSEKTKARFTFKITTSDDKRMRFVSVLNGSDNNSNYAYIGHAQIGREVFWHGRKSKIASDAPSVVAFEWAWWQLNKGNMPVQLQVWHEGRCARCGLRLTVPSSIASGFGPECIKKIAL